MIKKFSVNNFRNVTINDLDFSKVNILIGPNNSGKSNFIKALSFSANIVANEKEKEATLNSAFLSEVQRNGWERLLNKYSERSREVEFNWTINLDGEDCVYKFAFNVGDADEPQKTFFITKEILDSLKPSNSQDRSYKYFQCHEENKGIGYFSTANKVGQRNSRIGIKVDNRETVLLQIKDLLIDNPKLYNASNIREQISIKVTQLLNYFKHFYAFSSAQFDINAVRKSVELTHKGMYLQSDASNFTNVFNYYKSKDMFFKVKFEKKLKELMKLDMVDISIEYDRMFFKIGLDGKEYDIRDMSDGTIKIMIIALLLTIPKEDSFSVLAIDEPEMNFHPAWQKVVAKWILSTQDDRQFFISTHSPDFLDVFTDSIKNGNVSVFIFNQNLIQKITKLDYERIREDIEKGWQLGDLYRTADPSIGGWPW